jgi:hypothetical protein
MRRVAHGAIRLVAVVLLVLPAYGLLAYVLLPASWSQYARWKAPRAAGVTRTAEGLPGDPLNVALVGSRPELVAAMRAAGWSPADPITLRSGLRDAASVLFARPYACAPVSTHFLWKRPQDMAFERAEGRSPRRRHHVRFWRADEPSADGRALWLGAATFDRSVGLSRYTGEVMHHIDPRVDLERDTLLRDLRAASRLEASGCEAGWRPAGAGRNGGGDPYVTDGRLCLGRLRTSAAGPAGLTY